MSDTVMPAWWIRVTVIATLSSMIDDPVLVDDWHPVAREVDLASGGPLAVRLLGEDIVVWRSGDRYFAWRDLCVHRGPGFRSGGSWTASVSSAPITAGRTARTAAACTSPRTPRRPLRSRPASRPITQGRRTASCG